MTTKRWTPADLNLAQQAIAQGKPANIIARGSSYETKKAEQQEQIWFIEWCEAQRYILTRRDGDQIIVRLEDYVVGYPGGAFLSGNEKRRAMQWSILKKMGCKAGVSDLACHIPAGGYHGAFIEMKKRRDQFASATQASQAVAATQTAFLERMRLMDYFTGVSFGWVDAATKLCRYLGWDPSERGL